MKTYEQHTEITKELLDSIKVGDLIKVNDWKKPLRVKGVSGNYFVMATRQFKDTVYSVCEKKPWNGARNDKMTGGVFHVGLDSWLFGWAGFADFETTIYGCATGYDFENTKKTAEYLQSFEEGKGKLYPRSAVPIRLLQIKRA